MAINLFGSRKKKIAGAIILVVIVGVAIFYGSGLAGSTGASPLYNGGAGTDGGGASIHLGVQYPGAYQ